VADTRAWLTSSVDPRRIEEIRRILTPRQLDSVLWNAVKRTTSNAVTIARRSVREQVPALTKKYLDRVVKSKVTGFGENPTGTVTISHERVPLIGFRPKATKTGGVTARVSKDRPPIILKHAFITFVGKGRHKGVFLRARGRGKGGKLTRRGYARRLPIEERFGPSVLDVIRFPKVERRVRDEIGNALEKNLASRLARYLKDPRTANADSSS
jgi:hypothetical protein